MTLHEKLQAKQTDQTTLILSQSQPILSQEDQKLGAIKDLHLSPIVQVSQQIRNSHQDSSGIRRVVHEDFNNKQMKFNRIQT